MGEDIQSRLFQIFFPYATEKMAFVKEHNTRFVHYTSAAVGLSIIEKQSVWMRNAKVMNDFAEIEHGLDCVKGALHDDVRGTRLKAALHRIDAGIWDSVIEKLEKYVFHHRHHSYLVSVSEHGNSAVNGDQLGRLSMWRAYGGDTNVALVLNSNPFQADSDALHSYTSPVLYADAEAFKGEFEKVVVNLENSIEDLIHANPEDVALSFFNALHFAVLSTKHPGFSEEREWRVVHSPTLHPSERMQFDIECIEGVPQKVYKLPMQNIPEEGLIGMAIPELISEVIIGPTEFPWQIFEAFCVVLERAGVEDPQSIVKVSGIPLRR